MTILFAPEAEEDFAALIGYLAERNPAAAAELGRRIFAIIDKLAERHFDGPETVLETSEIVQTWAVPPGGRCTAVGAVGCSARTCQAAVIASADA
ncbi:MAG TPA: type II toxin-antitoxin system RelE/ParE family toxin [Kofleriaceae bacterium]|nr:type II toxin-antitoxin system RelE/ParE family toxin [Kofleriaceae bacterium]